tara:strand:- start:273 stop:491 length:219 start_codon:yes stop_codon:yes gene_type:complete
MGNMFAVGDGLNHLGHSIVLFFVSHIVMTQVLGQSPNVAFDRSIVLFGIALLYMIMFGHQFPPGNLNPNLSF